MKIGIIGTGYVGLVTGACLAEVGNSVICVDSNKQKIEELKTGVVSIYEPGLTQVVLRNSETGRLRFTTEIKDIIDKVDALFIAVGTPADEDGSADLSHVIAVAESIGKHISKYCLVVTKSTVPVGTNQKIKQTIQNQLNIRQVQCDFDIASNPEFLKEGAAVHDFMFPDRIILGVENKKSEQILRDIYSPYNRTRDKVIVMDPASSELTKYAANCILATKISLMNEIANIADLVGSDIEKVRIGIGSDPRIGYHFIYPGAGYGGSCFPKDVRALSQIAKEHGLKANLLEAVETVNDTQKKVVFNKIKRHFKGRLSGKTIGIWGLSFKPNTDDIREAPSLILIQNLLDSGAIVRCFDPHAMEWVKTIFKPSKQISYHDNEMKAADGCDALALITEWKIFWSPDFTHLSKIMQGNTLFDGRNIWNPKTVAQFGFNYYGIGRPAAFTIEQQKKS